MDEQLKPLRLKTAQREACRCYSHYHAFFLLIRKQKKKNKTKTNKQQQQPILLTANFCPLFNKLPIKVAWPQKCWMMGAA